MLEELRNTTSSNKGIWSLKKAGLIGAILLTLTGCGAREKFLKNRVDQGNGSIYQSSKIYKGVALEENAQQDAKTIYPDDPLLDLAIKRSHEWVDEQKKVDAKTVNRTANYQEALANIQRHKKGGTQETQEYTRLDPHALEGREELYKQTGWAKKHGFD